MRKLFLYFGCSLVIYSCATVSNDEKAIRTLLEKEAATWRSGDTAAHAACWQERPYSKVLVSTGDGKVIDVPVDAVIHPKGPADGGSAAMLNVKMSIHGDQAWVSHEEISMDTLGKKTRSYEIRILEKVGGDWKLVGQSIHVVGL